MQLINNRYKIQGIHLEDDNGTVYRVVDLWNSNKNLLLKLFETNTYNKVLFEYFLNNFIKFSNLKYKYLLECKEFDIIRVIDNKKANKKMFFYTKEYTDGLKLNEIINQLSFEDILDIIRQLCDTLDYLRFRGFTYDFLFPNSVFITNENDKFSIKVRDMASVHEMKVRDSFNHEYRLYIAPEVFIKNRKDTLNSDIYSLGKIFSLLLNTYLENNQENKDVSKDDIRTLIDLIGRMTKDDPDNRESDLRIIIETINSVSKTNYYLNFNDERQQLSFSTEIIGRNREVERVLKIDRDFKERKYETKLLAIYGEEGIGKTRLLDELNYRLRMKGRAIYNVTVAQDITTHFEPIKKILKHMIQSCDDDLIDKYGSELVKVVPELSVYYDISPSSALGGEKERLRLYDRITNFIVDFINNEPTYIFIDDFHNSDIETIRFINYFIINNLACPLLFVISYNDSIIFEKTKVKEIIDTWINYRKVGSLNLYRFNLQESALMIKNILGINYMPMKFATRISNETGGNPRHIEEVIKNLYASKMLFLNSMGKWELKYESYSEMYIPANIDEAIKRQVDLLEHELYEVSKIISLFRTSVSKGILSSILKKDSSNLDKLIDKLLGMKILDEKVEDWGYTYDFYNIQMKKYIYHSIEFEEREELHRLVSEILEKVFLEGQLVNIDELVYHLTLSNQIDKAINHIMDQAKGLEGFVGNVQAVSLWKKAEELLDNKLDKRRVEVELNLGRIYSYQGSNEKALKLLFKALDGAIKLNETSFNIITRNLIADIFLLKNDPDRALEHIEESKRLSDETKYIEGFIEASRIENKIWFQKNQHKMIIKNTKKYIKIAKNKKLYRHVAHFYNHMGIYHTFERNIDEARECYENSIRYFDKSGFSKEATKAINNIGVIYADYYGDNDKAMEYFEKGLSISQKYNERNSEIIFLINIGESYLDLDKYDKAKEYLLDAEKLANEIGNEVDLFLINIDLGRIYLKIGDYEKCFKQLHIVNEAFLKQPQQGQNISEYYDFLSQVYYSLGCTEKAYEYSLKTIENSAMLRLTLLAEGRLIIIKYYNEGILDKEAIKEFLDKSTSNNLKYIKRLLLLEFTKLALKSNDKEYALMLLDFDRQLSQNTTTDLLDVKRELLTSNFKSDPVSSLLEIERRYKNKYLLCDIYIYRTLGDEFYKRNNYYKAIYYYLITLDLIHRIIRRIPNRELSNKYLDMHNIENLLSKINSIQSALNLNEHHYKITKNIFFEEHFDLAQFRGLFDKSEFFSTVFEKFSDNKMDNITNISELVMNFTENHRNNLKMILEFAMKETLASRGFICAYNSEKDSIKVLESSEKDIDLHFINQVTSRVRRKGDGLLIRNSSKLQKEYVYLEDNIKALICVPIYKRRKIEEIITEERRSNNYFNGSEIIGYIYLDSDMLFNRFDDIRYYQIEVLSNLAFIVLDNYNLMKTSSIDMLTGVFTRKYFDIVSKEILDKNRKNELELSIIMIDIDKFKAVNDTFGHRKGDEVLRKIGEIISKNVRDTDIVGRYGGEEFIIMLPNTSQEQSIMVAEKIRNKVENSQIIGEDYPITISLGISVFPHHGEYSEELIEKADQALYNAKTSGRNKSVIWRKDIGKTNKRFDKLVGIVSGNIVQDQRNVLAMVEIIDLIKQKSSKKEKIYKFLGRLIEIVEGNLGVLLTLDNDLQIKNVFAREIFNEEWVENIKYNPSVIQKVIETRTGEYFIDWEDVENIDALTGTPNWQSVIVTPLIFEGQIKGILQISVGIKEKEFDYDTFNFVKTIGDIMAAII